MANLHMFRVFAALYYSYQLCYANLLLAFVPSVLLFCPHVMQI